MKTSPSNALGLLVLLASTAFVPLRSHAQSFTFWYVDWASRDVWNGTPATPLSHPQLFGTYRVGVNPATGSAVVDARVGLPGNVGHSVAANYSVATYVPTQPATPGTPAHFPFPAVPPTPEIPAHFEYSTGVEKLTVNLQLLGPAVVDAHTGSFYPAPSNPANPFEFLGVAIGSFEPFEARLSYQLTDNGTAVASGTRLFVLDRLVVTTGVDVSQYPGDLIAKRVSLAFGTTDPTAAIDLVSPHGQRFAYDPMLFGYIPEGTMALIPEPSSWVFATGLGLLALGAWRRCARTPAAG